VGEASVPGGNEGGYCERKLERTSYESREKVNYIGG